MSTSSRQLLLGVCAKDEPHDDEDDDIAAPNAASQQLLRRDASPAVRNTAAPIARAAATATTGATRDHGGDADDNELEPSPALTWKERFGVFIGLFDKEKVFAKARLRALAGENDGDEAMRVDDDGGEAADGGERRDDAFQSPVHVYLTQNTNEQLEEASSSTNDDYMPEPTSGGFRPRLNTPGTGAALRRAPSRSPATRSSGGGGGGGSDGALVDEETGGELTTVIG